MPDQSTVHKKDSGYFEFQRPEMLKYIPVNSKSILEVGCGAGTFCATLKREDREIWGVEIDPDMAQVATDACTFVLVGDFNTLFDQLPKNYFDCVIFNDVLEHLYNPSDAICLVKELLKPNGVLVSSIPNFRYISNLIIEILWQKDFQYKPEGGILDDTHIRFFTSKSILRMFQNQGYEILIHEGIKPCKSWKEKLLIMLTFGLLDDARYKQFATVVKKNIK